MQLHCFGQDVGLFSLLRSSVFGIAVKYPVAKLVKSFGLLSDATESLDDFRYASLRSHHSTPS